MILVVTFRLSQSSWCWWLCDPQVLILSATPPGLTTCSLCLVGFPIWFQLVWKSVSSNRTDDLCLFPNPWLSTLTVSQIRLSMSFRVTQLGISRAILRVFLPLPFFPDSISHQGLPANSIFSPRVSETLLFSVPDFGSHPCSHSWWTQFLFPDGAKEMISMYDYNDPLMASSRSANLRLLLGIWIWPTLQALSFATSHCESQLQCWSVCSSMTVPLPPSLSILLGNFNVSMSS